MCRRVSWVGTVSVLLVLVTGSGPVRAQESRRNMFDGLFGPPLGTPPSFSRPQATLTPTTVASAAATTMKAGDAVTGVATSIAAKLSGPA